MLYYDYIVIKRENSYIPNTNILHASLQYLMLHKIDVIVL